MIESGIDPTAGPGGVDVLPKKTEKPGGLRNRINAPLLVYLGKRLGIYALTATAAVVLNFFLPRLMPGDPVNDMIRRITVSQGRPPSQYIIDNMRALYGDPNEPLIGQFFNYLLQLSRGDLGLSVMKYPTPVIELIGQTLPWTLGLALITVLIAWVVGTFFGTWLGWKPSSAADKTLTPLLMFFHSIPAFWLGLIAVWYFAYENYYFPPQGGFDPNISPQTITNPEYVWSVIHHGFLPALVLVVVGFAGWLFGMRNMMITTANEDYVTLARAKGLLPRNVMLRYAARNAMLPNVTGLAQAIGGLLGSIVLVESVFVYPGMGQLLGEAIGQRDYPVMQAILLMTIALTLVANFIADTLYLWLDPRTREQ
ncbi:MAG: ABC transporter permease [Propionibacteriaceae bacterium]|nr:ABC transporter permease [Propionibacteriaceae bacterium]